MTKKTWGNVKLDSDTTSECGETEVVGNSIYFYEDITSKSILNLNKEIKALESLFLYEQIQRKQTFISPINLYIMSHGGEIIPALAGMDTILKCEAPVHTIVDGGCASAATFLSIVGKKRYIKQNSFMMIHQLRAETFGKYNEVKDDIKNIEQWMNIMRNIYSKYTSVPLKKLNEVLKHDLWWDAELCLKYGLVDEII